MPHGIRADLDNLVTLQAALTITSPISQQIKKAYKTFPKQDGAPETPCFINFPSMPEVTHIFSARQATWVVRSQLLVYDADRNQAADIVLAYLEKYLDALSAAQTLNGVPVIQESISAGDLGAFEYGGQSYTGIEVTVTLKVPLEAVTVEA